jgi:AhpD family alkylhydroperoxidase
LSAASALERRVIKEVGAGHAGAASNLLSKEIAMQARMKNPAALVPDAMPTLLALGGLAKKSGLPAKTLGLVHLRASQINGCGFCLGLDVREAKERGESQERLLTVAGFRESPYFDDAERAALALTEAVTRLADRGDAVSDELWEECKRHYDEPKLAALVLAIATVNFWNRLNVPTRQVAGSGW